MSFDVKIELYDNRDFQKSEKRVLSLEMNSDGVVKIKTIGKDVEIYINDLWEHVSKFKAANDIGNEYEESKKTFQHIVCKCGNGFNERPFDILNNY